MIKELILTVFKRNLNELIDLINTDVTVSDQIDDKLKRLLGLNFTELLSVITYLINNYDSVLSSLSSFKDSLTAKGRISK